MLDLDVGLLILRLVIGLTIAAHGAQKLFGWFGGYGLKGFGGWLEESLGLKPGAFWAALAAGAEFIGGILFAAGLWVSIASILIAIVMLVAFLTVHLKNGLFIDKNGFEYVLVLLIITLFVGFVTGPGAYAIHF